MTSPPWHVSVLIPARNEEDLLPRCLRSVFKACSSLPAGVTSDVIVAVDNSTDRTLAIAENMLQRRGATVVTDAGVVGQARALAAQVALQRYSGSTRRCWLANTDADCIVPAGWLNDQLSIADSGVEVIAGIVDVDSFDEHQPFVRDRFLKSYMLRPDGSHPHVHGANIGVRADAYLRAGGWSELATAEDHDLWHRLATAGAARASVSRVKVVTSGRRVGRAPLGFAGALAAHNETTA